MKDAELLEQLEEIIRQLGIELVWDDGEFKGGICTIEGKQLFLMNRILPSSQKVEILCCELSSLDLSQIFILPRVRQRIEQARKPTLPARSRNERDRGVQQRGEGAGSYQDLETSTTTDSMRSPASSVSSAVDRIRR